MKIKACKVCQMGAELKMDKGIFVIQGITDNILRCIYTEGEKVQKLSPIGIEVDNGVDVTVEENDGAYIISSKKIRLEADKQTGQFLWRNKETGEILLREAGKELTQSPLMVYSTGEEKPVIRRVQTVDGERNFVENLQPVMDHMAYRGKLYFQWDETEQIHGLGQGEEGIYDYRGNVQYLYQHNMRIPIPFFLSSKNYGILADCGSLMTFNDDARGSY